MKKIILVTAALLLFSANFVFAQVSDKFTYLNSPFNTAYNLTNVFPDPIVILKIDRKFGTIGVEIKSYILNYTQKMPDGGFNFVIIRIPVNTEEYIKTTAIIPLTADGQMHQIYISLSDNEEIYLAPHSWNPDIRGAVLPDAPKPPVANGAKPVKVAVAPPAGTYGGSLIIFGVNCSVQSL